MVRKQVSDQYRSLKLKSSKLDITNVATLSRCLEDLEAKRQKLLAELKQVEYYIRARKSEKEQALASARQERENIKSEFLKLQAIKNRLTPGTDADDHSFLNTIEKLTESAVKCIDDLLAESA
jgi:DNA repair exonuclease SbcCD ATPase subunit